MFRKSLILLMILPASGFAAVEFENGDASKEASMCIEAVLNEDFKVTSSNENVTCNGLKINDFIKTYRARMNEAADMQVTVYQLEPTDDKIETQLCIAAAESKQKLMALAERAQYSSYTNVMCNGKKIEEFALDLMN